MTSSCDISWSFNRSSALSSAARLLFFCRLGAGSPSYRAGVGLSGGRLITDGDRDGETEGVSGTPKVFSRGRGKTGPAALGTAALLEEAADADRNSRVDPPGPVPHTRVETTPVAPRGALAEV